MNSEIDSEHAATLFKIHYLPHDLLNRYGVREEDRIVYVRRNPLDVVVSGFFYFRYRGDQRYAIVRPGIRSLISPSFLRKHWSTRKALDRWIEEFCSSGFPVFGDWKAHVISWNRYFEENPGVIVAWTSYEALHFDTSAELAKVVATIADRDVGHNRVVDAVAAEEFTRRRREIADSNGDELTYGKRYNARFLRSGKVGDYASFLSGSQIATLTVSLGEALE